PAGADRLASPECGQECVGGRPLPRDRQPQLLRLSQRRLPLRPVPRRPFGSPDGCPGDPGVAGGCLVPGTRARPAPPSLPKGPDRRSSTGAPKDGPGSRCKAWPIPNPRPLETAWSKWSGFLDTVLAVAEKGESPVPNPAPGSGSGRLARLVIGLCVARDRVGSGRHWRLPP